MWLLTSWPTLGLETLSVSFDEDMSHARQVTIAYLRNSICPCWGAKHKHMLTTL